MYDDGFVLWVWDAGIFMISFFRGFPYTQESSGYLMSLKANLIIYKKTTETTVDAG